MTRPESVKDSGCGYGCTINLGQGYTPEPHKARSYNGKAAQSEIWEDVGFDSQPGLE